MLEHQGIPGDPANSQADGRTRQTLDAVQGELRSLQRHCWAQARSEHRKH